MDECRYYEMCGRRSGSRNLPRACDDRNCWMFRPMPDVKALLKLADEIERKADEALDESAHSLSEAVATSKLNEYTVRNGIARRIREALGVVA